MTKTEYQIAREAAGYTQERASQYLNISVDTLGSYEQGRRTVPDDIVVKMADVYDYKLLCYKHLSSKTCAKDLPQIEEIELAQAVVQLLASTKSFEKSMDKLVELASDNQITEDEVIEFKQIQAIITDLTKACFSFQYCKTKK